MNEIVQHIPAFVETTEPRSRATFDTLAELLKVPFVSTWAEEPIFHQFSVDGGCLMAELRGGCSWWVVGHLRDPVPELPAWNKGIYEVTDENGNPLDVPGRDVSYSQGDKVGLRDGRVLKKRR